MTVKLTKTELRVQQVKLAQLQKYLPTLQLKKSMLQMEVLSAVAEIEALTSKFNLHELRVTSFAQLFTDRFARDLFESVKILKVHKKIENIAGVDIPHFVSIDFAPAEYSLFNTPIWMETAIANVQEWISIREQIKIANEKKKALEKELREVSIRVNLFEKIMIPRAIDNIKKIKIFLGDQELAAVSQAKVAKRKIALRRLQENKEISV